MLALLIIAASILPQPAGVARDSVDRLELNTVHDGEGRVLLTQLIGWSADGRVRFWRMYRGADMTPKRDHVRGGWVLRWNDDGNFREVRANSFEETHAQEDAEIVDRQVLPAEKRRPLRSR